MRKTRVLVYAGGGGSGGYVRYCRGLFASGSLPDSVEVWFISSSSFHELIGLVDASVNVVSHPWIYSSFFFKRFLWHAFLYPNLVYRLKPDVEFYTSGILPPFRRLWKGRNKIISTCHNLLPFCIDESQSDGPYAEIKSQFHNQVRSLKSSDAIIFLSKYSKEVVSTAIGKHINSIVVAHGIDSSFRSVINRSYKLESVINILYTSTIFPYKHQKEVVSAIKLLRQQTGFEIQLKLVGGGPSKYVNNLINFVKEQEATSYVTIIRYLDDKALRAEYNLADIFVFASDCETFGIILLEAMAQGLPIACSKATGLVEILRDAGNQHTCKRIGEQARQYSLQYTWEKCADTTFKFIGKI